MHNVTQLHIPTPCQEKWSEMTPMEPDCRHCVACDRQIVDFSTKTDAEVLAFMRRNGGKICGRFDRKQLDRPLQRHAVSKARQFRRGSLTALAASFAALLAARQPIEPKPVFAVPTEQFSTTKPGPGLKLETPAKDSVRTVSGRVLDETGMPLLGVTISVERSSYKTMTDADGFFRLELPQDFVETQINVQILIRYTGYMEQTVNLPEKVRTQDMSLKPVTMDPGTLVGEIVITHPNLKKRIHYFFHNLFH